MGLPGGKEGEKWTGNLLKVMMAGNKLDNSEGINKIPRKTQTNKMNSRRNKQSESSYNEWKIELVTKKDYPQRKAKPQMASLLYYIKHLKIEYQFFMSFSKIEEETLLNSLCEAIISLIPKPDQDIQRKGESHKSGCKTFNIMLTQKNTVAYGKNCTPWPTGTYHKDSRLVWYLKTNKPITTELKKKNFLTPPNLDH